MTRLLTAAALLICLALLPACPATGEACTEEGEDRCEGEMISTCTNGTWSDPVECGAGGCMVMDSGLEHCM
jgi:hypothetical protein